MICAPSPAAESWVMPALTRRRERDRHQESWQIYYGDICVGWIGERAGVPKDVEQWGWNCGFYPVSHRGFRSDGVAGTFEQARREFEAAWNEYLLRCTDADFHEYRSERAFTTWKYAMWKAGCKMPTQTVSGIPKCFCGVMINNRTSGDHIRARHMEVTA
jgi:hypothetical protein